MRSGHVVLGRLARALRTVTPRAQARRTCAERSRGDRFSCPPAFFAGACALAMERATALFRLIDSSEEAHDRPNVTHYFVDAARSCLPMLFRLRRTSLAHVVR